SARENDIHLEPHELGCNLGIALRASLPPAVLDRDGATLDPAEFAQPLHKCVDPCALAYWAAPTEVPDGRQLPRLLRARCKRPRRGRAAECGQQFPPSDGDCHTPLPCEVRKRNDTTSRACSLAVQGGQDAGRFHLCRLRAQKW